MVPAQASERDVSVIVQYDNQPYFAGKVQDSMERLVSKCGITTRHLGGHKFFVNAKLADARKHTRKGRQHALNVVGSIAATSTPSL
jgi:hypothetical protein